MSEATRIHSLQRTPLFGGASDDVVALVLERASPIAVAAGDYFFREGDRGVSTFWLERGEVEIRKRREERDVALRTLGAGDCFGEVALFDFGPRSASVRAVVECEALEISPALLREIRERDLEQFTLLTMNLGRELSRRLRTAETRLFLEDLPGEATDPVPTT